MKRLYLITVAILMTLSTAFAQSVTMSGIVVDENNVPIPGVGISEIGTQNGVFTDIDGGFSISLKSTRSEIRLDFLGYKSVTVPYTAKKQKISMYPEVNTVEEVVVVAYGTQKKQSVVGSISSASSEELKQMGTPNLSNALAGVVSGITFSVPSGQPGLDDAKIYIRGISTFSGNATPLVLVDGVERDFSQVDPEDIAQLSVLKDASATAVYGVRGANGAILITTKRGTKNAPQLSLSYTMTLQEPTRLPEFLQSYDHAVLRNESLANDGQPLAFDQADIEHYLKGDSPYTHPDNDYVEDFIRKVSPMHKLNVGVRGGTEKVRYYVALSGLSQSGIYKQFDDARYESNAGYKRMNLRANLDFSLTKTTDLSLDLNGRLDQKRNVRGELDNGSIFENMYVTPPMFYPYTLPDGSYGQGTEATTNLLALLKEGGFTKMNTSTVEGTLKLNQRLDFITTGLSVRGSVSFNNYFDSGSKITYTPAYYKYIPGDTPDKWTKEEGSPETNPSISNLDGNGLRRRINYEAAIEYNRTFGNHAVTGLLLYNVNRMTRSHNLPQAFIGYAARATYAYKSKYLFEVNLGYNGSDQFAEGHRYALFPSMALGYVLTNEDFMKPLSSWFTFFKIRASYGEVGNDKIGSDRFLYLQTYDKSNNGYFFGSDVAFGGQAILKEGALGNENVTWEIGKKTNVGIEMTFFDALDLNLDLFNEYRENIFTARQTTPQTLGVASAKENIGRVQNRGFEIEGSYSLKFQNGLSWRIGGMFSYSRNKVLYKDEVTPKYEYLRQTGKAINQFFGYTILRYYLPDDFITDADGNRSLKPELPQPAVGGAVQPGDFMYADLNDDKVIDVFDKGPIGFTPVPRIVYNINSNLRYKNFDFSILFQGTGQVSKLMTKSLYEPVREKNRFQDIHKYRWTEERWKNGEKILYPRLSSSTNNHNQTTNTFYLKKGNYLRLKNIELGYTFNKKQLDFLGLKSLRVYVSGNNVFTWSEIKNFDPELGDSSGFFYPQMKLWNLGVNINF